MSVNIYSIGHRLMYHELCIMKLNLIPTLSWDWIAFPLVHSTQVLDNISHLKVAVLCHILCAYMIVVNNRDQNLMLKVF